MWRRFFQDKQGKIVIWQWPNVYLWAWIVLAIAGRIFNSGKPHEVISTLAFVTIIIWSYVEITDNVNYFRRSLGAVVLIVAATSHLK